MNQFMNQPVNQTNNLNQPMNNMNFKKISEEQMRRYFEGRRNYIGFILIGVGILVGFLFHSLVVGLVIVAVGVAIIIVINGRQITDRDYDEWLAQRENFMETVALQKVYLDYSQVIQPPLFVHGGVNPSLDELVSHIKVRRVFKKQGKDNRYRYSKNTYTFFFPVEHHIAVLIYEIDALRQRRQWEQTAHYFYKDIVGIKTEFIEENITNDKETISIQLKRQSFSLRVANGDVVDTGDILSVTVPGQNSHAINVGATVAALLVLLRQKKQDSLNVL